MKQRPILVAVIGYIIGILWGLYFTFSIVLCYILMLTTYYFYQKFLKSQRIHGFKLLSFHRYKRYIKLMMDSKTIFILIIVSIISNLIVLYQNDRYNYTYQDGEEVEITGIIVSQKMEKKFYNLYQVKLLKAEHINLYIQVNKKIQELEYGDKVILKGIYQKPKEQRNYGGYDDKQYLKTLKILGRVRVNYLEVKEKKQLNSMIQLANEMNGKIKKKIEELFGKEKSAILKGLLLGETTDIQEEIKEGFQISNISHILAVSGMHISYIITGIQLLGGKFIGKRKARIITILILILYASVIGFSPSVLRAVAMGIIMVGSGIVYRKNDVWNAIAISLLGILIYNPFLILNVGLQLSYLGTMGIILFHSTILKFLNYIKLKQKSVVFEKIKEIIAVTISAQIAILPIMLYHFNILGIYFLVTNLLVSLVIGSIILLAFLCIIISFFFVPITKVFVLLLNIGIEGLILISKFSELPFSKIYLPTPSKLSLLLYFIAIGAGNYVYRIYSSKQLTTTYRRVKNLIALFQYKFRQKKKKYFIYFTVILSLFICFGIFSGNLKIYFVDVGQGDATFILTPRNKTILIDGGGSLTDDFNVGKKTLVPYLLDRGVTTLDYIIISHFDQDHVRFYFIFITRNKSEKCHNRKAI